jgi:hypothetical protein
MFNKLEARVLSEYKRSRAAPSTFCTLIKHYFSFIKHYITTDTVVISFVFSSWIINVFFNVLKEQQGTKMDMFSWSSCQVVPCPYLGPQSTTSVGP